MPKFTLDFQWTPRALWKVLTGDWSPRKKAMDYAVLHGVQPDPDYYPNHIVDRLLFGPVWYVVGVEDDVKKVVGHFNSFGNVKATYQQRFSADELTTLFADLVKPVEKPS